MQINVSAYNALQEQLLSGSKQRLSRHKMPQQSAAAPLMLCAAMAMLLLSGCATQLPPPCEQPASPLMPATVSSPPTEPYSLSAAALFKKWQAMLISASATSKP